MLGSFLSSLKEKSGADKRCRANLPAVRLQGQAKDKTGVQIRLETPTAEPRAVRVKILGPDIKWKEEALELWGQSSQKINYTYAPMPPSSAPADILLASIECLGWRPQQAVAEVCVSTDRVNLMLEKSSWQGLAQHECKKRDLDVSESLPCFSFTACLITALCSFLLHK